MRRLPVSISILTVLFFIFSLTSNILISDPAAANAEDRKVIKKKIKKKVTIKKTDGQITIKKKVNIKKVVKKGGRHDDDKDNDRRGGNGVPKQIRKLNAKLNALQTQVNTIELTPGPQGEQGDPGPVGPQGPAGNDGADGAQGPVGPIGATGAAGTNGTNGADGADGSAGADGQNGVNGQDGADGAQGPVGPIGATGTAGTNGTNGADGADGQDGVNGQDGADGAQGPVGPIGATGAAGTNGANGTNGVDGQGGVNGQDGADGAQGPVGLTGPAGVAGPQGPQGNPGTPKLHYVTGQDVQDGRDDGIITGRVLSFIKESSTSLLRVTYSDNIRVHSAGTSFQWKVLLDGAGTNIITSLHNTASGNVSVNSHRQSTVIGYLSGVPAGVHTLSARVTQIGGTPGGDAFTGWNSTFLLQAEEIENPVTLTTGLVGYWPLDGNFQDHSVSGIHGSPNGNVGTTASNVKFGQSGTFDGNGDYIRVANNPAFTFGAGSSFTLSAWVWPNTTTGVHRIITNDENGFDLRIISNQYQFEFKPSGQPGQSLISSIPPVGGQWSLVTLVKTPSVITIYVNGIAGGTLVIADGPLSSTHDLTIGSYTPGTSEFFNGLMDDVAIWNRALTFSEITQLLSQPVLP
jgi:hypothetical protein